MFISSTSGIYPSELPDIGCPFLSMEIGLPFSPVSDQLFCFPPVKSPKSYNQPQIILNSGRLLFNSISDSIIFSSHKSIVAEARLDAALKSQTRNVNIIAEKGIVRVGTERADQSAVKGDDFNIQFGVGYMILGI